jgi:hypothetical protein
LRLFNPSGGGLFGGTAPETFTPGTTYYWDDPMVDANGTAMTSHTGNFTPGGYANFLSASMQIQGNACTILTPTASSGYALFDPAQATYKLDVDYLIRTTATDNSNRQATIFFRYLDLTNYHYCNITMTAGQDSSTTVYLVKSVLGVTTAIGTWVFAIAAGSQKHLHLEISSTGIMGTVDGNAISGSSSDLNTVTPIILGLTSNLTGLSGPYYKNLTSQP